MPLHAFLSQHLYRHKNHILSTVSADETPHSRLLRVIEHALNMLGEGSGVTNRKSEASSSTNAGGCKRGRKNAPYMVSPLYWTISARVPAVASPGVRPFQALGVHPQVVDGPVTLQRATAAPCDVARIRVELTIQQCFTSCSGDVGPGVRTCRANSTAAYMVKGATSESHWCELSPPVTAAGTDLDAIMKQPAIASTMTLTRRRRSPPLSSATFSKTDRKIFDTGLGGCTRGYAWRTADLEQTVFEARDYGFYCSAYICRTHGHVRKRTTQLQRALVVDLLTLYRFLR
jgi:hypothetical protein